MNTEDEYKDDEAQQGGQAFPEKGFVFKPMRSSEIRAGRLAYLAAPRE
jgi:hypothetical protein